MDSDMPLPRAHATRCSISSYRLRAPLHQIRVIDDQADAMMKSLFRSLFRSFAGALLACAFALPPLAAHSAPAGTFDTDTFAQIRARYAGKPLVVHIWAMSCGPCLAELPKWGELVHRRPDLHLVLVEFDPAPREASERQLTEAGLRGIESWAVASEPDEYLRASIDRKWFGDMPRTLLIAPTGEVTSIRGAADLSMVRRWLDAQRPAR